MSGTRVVAFGGGHGLSASLEALRLITDDLTAVVTVADDGGSSGRLRAELGALPPGDLRMALAALAGTDDWGRVWARLAFVSSSPRRARTLPRSSSSTSWTRSAQLVPDTASTESRTRR